MAAFSSFSTPHFLLFCFHSCFCFYFCPCFLACSFFFPYCWLCSFYIHCLVRVEAGSPNLTSCLRHHTRCCLGKLGSGVLAVRPRLSLYTRCLVGIELVRQLSDSVDRQVVVWSGPVGEKPW